MPNVKKLNRNYGKLSEHFSASEFACNDGTNELLFDFDLIPILERFREYVESPITINSGYRTETYNTHVGGAPKSYHVKGRALDIPFKSTYKNLNSLEKMCNFFNTLGLGGIIKYTSSNFVHIDTRETNYHALSSGKLVNYSKVNIPLHDILKKGTKSVDVGILQFKLNKLGYNCGHADMDFGDNTEKAVKKYQQDHNLKVDGIVGNITWKNIF